MKISEKQTNKEILRILIHTKLLMRSFKPIIQNFKRFDYFIRELQLMKFRVKNISFSKTF